MFGFRKQDEKIKILPFQFKKDFLVATVSLDHVSIVQVDWDSSDPMNLGYQLFYTYSNSSIWNSWNSRENDRFRQDKQKINFYIIKKADSNNQSNEIEINIPFGIGKASNNGIGFNGNLQFAINLEAYLKYNVLTWEDRVFDNITYHYLTEYFVDKNDNLQKGLSSEILKKNDIIDKIKNCTIDINKELDNSCVLLEDAIKHLFEDDFWKNFESEGFRFKNCTIHSIEIEKDEVKK